MPRSRTTYRRDEFEDFEGKLRRFNESLAHRERRMLRSIIAAALEDGDDTSGYMELSDEELFAALARLLTSETETVS